MHIMPETTMARQVASRAPHRKGIDEIKLTPVTGMVAGKRISAGCPCTNENLLKGHPKDFQQTELAPSRPAAHQQALKPQLSAKAC